MAEKVILQVDVQGEGNLKRMDQNMGKFGKSTNTTQNELKRLRKELNDAKSDMASAEKGTEAYTRALNRSIVAQNKITEVNQKVRIATMDTGQTARYVASSISGLASGFQAAVGVMHLFGVENDKMLESIQKLQAIMSITQGLSQFSNSIHSMSQLFKSFGVNIEVSSNATKAFNDDVAKSGQVADKASEGIDKVSGKSAHMASNLAGVQGALGKVGDSLDIVTKKSEIYEDITNEVTLKNQTLADLYQDLSENTEEWESNLDILKGQYKDQVIGLDEYEEGQKELNTTYSELDKSLEKEIGGLKAEKRALQDSYKERIKAVEATDALDKSTKKLTSSISRMLKTLGTMLVFTAALWAISEAIGFIIKQINKIPEKIKLEIEIDENAYKSVQGVYEKVEKIRHNARIASNKKELDEVKDLLVKEKIATEEQVRDINDSKALLNADFWDGYLENVKIVAKNEAIIRKHTELELQKDLLEARLKSLEGTGKVMSKFWGGSDRAFFGMSNQISKATVKLEEFTKEWDTFLKAYVNEDGSLKLEPIKFDFGTSGSGGGATSFKDTQAWKDFEKTYDANKVQEALNEFEEDLKRNMKIGIDAKIKIEPIFPKTTIEEDEASVQHYLDYIAQLLNQGEINYEDYLNRKIEYLKRAEALGHDEWETSYLVEKELLDRKLRLYQDYINSISDTMSGIAGIYAAQMTEVDNYYKKEEELVNASVMGEKQKEKLLNDIAWARYEEQLVIFEKQKKAEEAAVWMNLASGLMGVYANAVRPDRLNPIVAWVQAGLETIALTTQAFASVKQIRAQRLDKPTQSSSSGAGNSVSLALNPTQTALTTKEENLNMIQQSNKTEAQAPVVKVSEINEVQNKVSVRESNTTY